MLLVVLLLLRRMRMIFFDGQVHRHGAVDPYRWVVHVVTATTRVSRQYHRKRLATTTKVVTTTITPCQRQRQRRKWMRPAVVCEGATGRLGRKACDYSFDDPDRRNQRRRNQRRYIRIQRR